MPVVETSANWRFRESCFFMITQNLTSWEQIVCLLALIVLNLIKTIFITMRASLYTLAMSCLQLIHFNEFVITFMYYLFPPLGIQVLVCYEHCSSLRQFELLSSWSSIHFSLSSPLPSRRIFDYTIWHNKVIARWMLLLLLSTQFLKSPFTQSFSACTSSILLSFSLVCTEQTKPLFVIIWSQMNHV